MSDGPPAGEPDETSVYRETVLSRRRRFTLGQDAVRVEQSGWSVAEVDTTIPFELLNPQRTRLRVRAGPVYAGAILLCVGLGFAIAAFEGWGGEDTPLLWIEAGSLGAAGLVTTACFLRRIEYISFKSDSGVPVLDVARAGPDATQFDAFLDRLTDRIQDARKPREPIDAGAGSPEK